MMTAVSGGLEVGLAASIIDMKAEDLDKPIRMSATVLKLKYLAFCVLVLSLGLDDPGRARKLNVSRISSLSRANPSFNAKVVATVSNKRSFTSGVRLLHPFGGHLVIGEPSGSAICSSLLQFLLAGGRRGIHPILRRASARRDKGENDQVSRFLGVGM